MELPSTARVLKALGSNGTGSLAVVPVTLKGQTVLYLWGESDSDGEAPLRGGAQAPRRDDGDGARDPPSEEAPRAL